MLCDKGKITAEKPYPCKYYFCRSYASESAGHIVEMFCKDEDIYGFADDMDDLSMIRLNDKIITVCTSYKPKIERKAKTPSAVVKKKKANQKKG